MNPSNSRCCDKCSLGKTFHGWRGAWVPCTNPNCECHQPPVASDGEEMSYEEFVELTKPAQPSPSWEGTINDAPFTAPDCWSKFDKDLRHTLDAFFNDMSEGAVATIKQHVRELLLSEKEKSFQEGREDILRRMNPLEAEKIRLSLAQGEARQS